MPLLLWLAAAAGARAQAVDPTPQSRPPIELDGSIGPGGDVPFDAASATWRIGDELGRYNESGSSLFHSFGRFDVPTSQTAEFRADHGLPERIFARVTWDEPSIIEGTLGSAIPGADLFLVNPAGIRLSGGARIDVQGSLYLTSAGRIDVSSGGAVDGAFQADPAKEPPLLSVAEPAVFGFLSTESAGGITLGALTHPLSLPPGETLGLLGGRVDVTGGGRRSFDSPGSRLALIAGGPGADVPFDLASFHPHALDASGSIPEPLGDVVLDDSRLFAFGTEAGSILVRAGRFEAHKSSLVVVHSGAQASRFDRGIDVDVSGDLRLDETTSLSAASTGAGDAGDLRLEGDAISVSGGSEVLVASTDTAPGSALRLRARSLELMQGGRFSSETRGPGPAGPIEVEVGRLSLSGGGQIMSRARGSGPGGEISIRADRVEISDAGFSPSGTVVASSTAGSAGATGGRVEIETQQLALREGGQIFASTQGAADAGAVRVRADSVEVTGVSRGAGGLRSSLIEARALPGSGGRAGQRLPDGRILGVAIDSRQLVVSNGAFVGTSTQAAGEAGDLEIRSSEDIRVRGGADGPGVLMSRAVASLDQPQVGDGGGISIDTGELELADGGQISTATGGTGAAGRIEIRAGQVLIHGRNATGESGLFAQSLATGLASGGRAGRIDVRSSGDFELRDSARVSVETSSGGDAGDIAIESGGSIRLARGASISARATVASSGRSGNVALRAGRAIVLADGASVSARSFGTAAAGRIRIRAGSRLELSDSAITTESITASNPGGGQIEVEAGERVQLADSTLNTSVAIGGGDGGDIRVDPAVVVLNRSRLLADAQDGDGGRIFIRAGAFVASSSSLVRASSLGAGSGVDGEIVIESPETDLTPGLTEPPRAYLDTSGLLKTSCGARGEERSSLVVARATGFPATPDGPLPSGLDLVRWIEARPEAEPAQGGPREDPSGLRSRALSALEPSIRLASLASDCRSSGSWRTASQREAER